MSKDNWFAVVPLAVIASHLCMPCRQLMLDCPGDPSLRGQRHSAGDGYRLYDGCRRTIAAEATMLKKMMTWRLIGIFFGLMTLFFILSGYLFNILLYSRCLMTFGRMRRGFGLIADTEYFDFGPGFARYLLSCCERVNYGGA